MRLALSGIGIAAADIDSRSLSEAGRAGTTSLCTGKKTDTTELNDFFPPRKLRRVDHFTRMTLLAACRALHDAAGTDRKAPKTPLPLPEKMGIIISSGYGPSQTIFEFLDSIIDHGAACASPLAFSHSVHNIPAATLSIFLGTGCPYTTICQTFSPLITALNNAAIWIAEGRVKTVLLGLVDEKTPLLEDNTKRILQNKHPNSKAALLPVGEGAVFFVLSDTDNAQPTKYGSLVFDVIPSGKLAEQVGSTTLFTPARTLKRANALGINASSATNADMPAAGLELALAALHASENGHSCCAEQAGDNFGLVKITKDKD
ncbi:beta-ketoacyl synthase chain length factor [Maridesulfovibrio hydrothermalis]|uniref:Beta-ketoacyl synthase-like N-terminal domain-containing protein n=1 Tax=Maridesulfovibrio hydrothermalis AM13 = DSM 14728 TaxID=1121451 RepID=L0R9J2_9BACT|nr:beta-ketoacyl synthase chain length factor [Maridesulfovibrio hydrothermalis]CCO23418.1 conserved protein of unknown function [Maridesulfovibrio hydrothermalis AM13 = DSM 14728]